MKKKIFMSMTMLTLAAVIIFIACKKNQTFQPRDAQAGLLELLPWLLRAAAASLQMVLLLLAFCLHPT